MQQVAPSGLIQSQLERSETAHTAETEEPAWRFIRREVIPQSINVGAAQLPDWLQEDEEMPTIRRLVYAALAYRLSTGRKLFTRAEACSRTKTPKGRYITVGDSPAGFIIGSWDGTPSKMFGLAPEVKHLPE